MRDAGSPMERGLAMAALGPDVSREIRAEAAWHLALRLGPASPDADLLAAVQAASRESATIDEAFGFDLAARRLGGPTKESLTWIARLRDASPSPIDALAVLGPSPALESLTPAEAAALSRRFTGSEDRLRTIVEARRSSELATGDIAGPRAMRILGGFPRAFMPDLAKTARCFRQGAVALALGSVVYGFDGRAERVRLADGAARDRCDGFSEAALLTSLLPDGDVPTPLVPETVLVVLHNDFPACAEEAAVQEENPPYRLPPSPQFTPPQLISPPGWVARPPLAGSQRVVPAQLLKAAFEVRVGSTGCTELIRVLSGSDIRLDADAIRNMATERYKPARREGTPVAMWTMHWWRRP
jgi:hypothetical protein